MYKFEVVNELILKATCVDGQGDLYTKAGAMIGYTGQNRFDKILLGPQGNPVQAAIGQVLRRVTGENLPLMRCKAAPGAISYYADDERHVIVIDLQPGESVMVESEDLLAFNEACGYGSKVLAQGVISQKGMFTSVITGRAPGAQVAILSHGNPLILESPCCADPDAVVAWTGSDPGFKLDVSFKTILGRSGESYQFEWKQPGSMVIIQPKERPSGISLRDKDRPQMQNSVSVSSAASSISGDINGMTQQLGQAANMLGGLFGGR